MSSVSEILSNYGRIQADLARQRGEIWGNFAINTGNIPLQIQQQQLLKAREQRLNQQAASEQQLTDLKLRGEQRAQAEQTALDQVWGADIWDDQGNMDPDKASAVAVANKAGHLVPIIREHAAKWAEQSARTREAQVKADEANAALDDRRRNSLGVAAIGVDPADEGSFSALIGQAAKQQWLSPADANRYLTAPPEARKSILQGFIQQSAEATRRTQPVERDITKQLETPGGTVIRPAQKSPAQAETERHNLQTEAETRQLRSETARHNLATEAGGDEAIQLTPAALDVTAHQYAMTGQLPPMGMGKKGAAVRTRIINRAAEIYKDLDLPSQQAAFKANQASLTTLQKQRDAIGAFEETAKKNIDIFLNTASKVVDTGSPLLNAPVRMLSAKVLGSPNQAQYDAARQVALSEIAKITSNPNLSGALSDSARHEVAAFNPDTATLKQTVAVMKLLKQDMDNRKGSLDDQLKDIRQRIAAPPAGTTPNASPGADPLGLFGPKK